MGELNIILNTALKHANQPVGNSSLFSFVVEEIDVPQCMEISVLIVNFGLALQALDLLHIDYRVLWPLNIVITQPAIMKYNRVFSFLLKLRRVNLLLVDIWRFFKSKSAQRSSDLKPFHSLRQEMQHFVDSLHAYIGNQVHNVTWVEFQTKLKNVWGCCLLVINLSVKVQSLDDLILTHEDFLEKILDR